MSGVKGTSSYDPQVDLLSQRVFETARDLAKDGALTADQKRDLLLERSAEIEAELSRLAQAGKVSPEQLDGGAHHLGAGPGGELGEIRAATKLALAILAEPDAAKKLDRNALLYTSDVFHNLTLTGESSAGKMIHLRFGTHGGLELRDRAPAAEGFPFPGSKWVEGDVVIGDRIFGFVSGYTDNFKVRLDDTGKPIALEFKGLVDSKKIGAHVLEKSAAKWTSARPATEPAGQAL